jgi:hypothetical protein
MTALIPERIVPSSTPVDMTPGRVAREFRSLLRAGATLRPAGEARHDPLALLSRGYTPKYKIALFDTVFYLTNIRQNPELRFFVAYVAQSRVRRGGARGTGGPPDPAKTNLYPRIFYKDVSLIWRSASHFVHTEDVLWVGKGDVRTWVEDGHEHTSSVESTTDLPLEVQTALEGLIRKTRSVPFDEVALELILHRAPESRIRPYRDFTEPRRRAAADSRNLVNGGKSVAYFTRRNDPTSLRFAAGFEPDFKAGLIERSTSTSGLYGGKVRRFRILSRNREIQYLFFAGPKQVWIIPPQATTTELSSYGVRTVDVIADEDAFVPGYEYHFMDESEDPPVLHTQIPEGYAGRPSPQDESRVDASPWLDRLPVIAEFRRKVLGTRKRRR